MKLVTYSRMKSVSCGILAGERLIDIASAWDGPNPPRSVKEILQRGPSCLAKLAELADSAEVFTPFDLVKLLAPISRPGKVIALAGNYSEHIREAGLERSVRCKAVRTKRYKYIRYFEQQPIIEELFDLKNDPIEAHNLVENPKYLDILTSLRKQCDNWIRKAK